MNPRTMHKLTMVSKKIKHQRKDERMVVTNIPEEGVSSMLRCQPPEGEYLKKDTGENHTESGNTWL
jgi:hypothetical protein